MGKRQAHGGRAGAAGPGAAGFVRRCPRREPAAGSSPRRGSRAGARDLRDPFRGGGARRRAPSLPKGSSRGPRGPGPVAAAFAGPSRPPRPPVEPGGKAFHAGERASPRRPLYLTSFGSRPVSLRIFSSTFLRLSLAFSSCSCKVLTATAIFSPQQASRLLSRPRLAVSRRETRGARQPGSANEQRRCYLASTTQRPEGGGRRLTSRALSQ